MHIHTHTNKQTNKQTNIHTITHLHTIVSRFPNETMSFGPQTFIVKLLIIFYTEHCSIYIGMERRGNRLAAGETEREGV
jgi:hypothetical protein